MTADKAAGSESSSASTDAACRIRANRPSDLPDEGSCHPYRPTAEPPAEAWAEASAVPASPARRPLALALVRLASA
jgi:hypothetical protein